MGQDKERNDSDGGRTEPSKMDKDVVCPFPTTHGTRYYQYRSPSRPVSLRKRHLDNEEKIKNLSISVLTRRRYSRVLRV